MKITDESNSQIGFTERTFGLVKDWLMIGLIFAFIVLYAAALLSLIEPLRDVSIIMRLEPIIFVIFGYYFGRLPAQTNEWTLRQELNRLNQKADAAQQIKETIQQQREVLEEKIRNAKLILSSNILSENEREPMSSAEFGNSAGVTTAIQILNS
ncbi:MAG: hypothetical protein ACKVQJ_03655 [Pyrinomonadaceae bacterium]